MLKMFSTMKTAIVLALLPCAAHALRMRQPEEARDIAMRHDVSSTEEGKTGNTYVFMAGLEGTGHSFYGSLFKACINSTACVKGTDSFYNALFGGSKQKINTSWAEQDAILARRPWEIDGKLIPMNTLVKELSYPYLHPGLHPDITNFAAIAEEKGYNLKILVLLRDARDVLASNARRWHRKEIDLVESAKVLMQQLQQIPRKMIKCQDYRAIPETGRALSKFLHIEGFDVEGTWEKQFKNNTGCSSHEIHCPKANSLEKQLKKLSSVICNESGSPPKLFAKHEQQEYKQQGENTALWLVS